MPPDVTSMSSTSGRGAPALVEDAQPGWFHQHHHPSATHQPPRGNFAGEADYLELLYLLVVPYSFGCIYLFKRLFDILLSVVPVTGRRPATPPQEEENIRPDLGNPLSGTDQPDQPYGRPRTGTDQPENVVESHQQQPQHSPPQQPPGNCGNLDLEFSF